MKKTNFIILLTIIISFIMGVYLYSLMPLEMASHWNSQGEVDGYLPVFWGLFLIPLISLGVFIFFLLIPKIDPLTKNIEKFREYFDWFILLIILFLLYIHSLSIYWNLGYRFNMGKMVVPALAILLFSIGIVLKKSKRNWFLGIRTPWTLSNDIVWDKTHKMGSKLFKLAAVIILLAMFSPQYSIWMILIPIIVIAIYLVIYSYFEYKQIKK